MKKNLPENFIPGVEYLSAFGMTVMILALLILISSCSTEYRLKEDFDVERLNAIPVQSPAPTPPVDNALWTQQFLQPTIVSREDGGQWVKIQPKPNYIGRNYAQALSAFSDYFKTDGNTIHGHLTMKVVGSGHVVIGLQASQNEELKGSYLGGYSIQNDITADVAYLTGHQVLTVLEQQKYWGPQGFGTFLAPYLPASTVELSWSIDQASRTLSLGVSPGGANNQVTFPPEINGVSNTPLRRIYMSIMVMDFTMNTTLFVDELTIEEEV